jgi:hypothetical protein
MICALGNSELWMHCDDPVQLREGPAAIPPLYLLYRYTFLPDGALTTAYRLTKAYQTRVVCTAWCWARIEETECRLVHRDITLAVVFVAGVGKALHAPGFPQQILPATTEKAEQP